MKLQSQRLKTIASCVRDGSVFADVGTDHAYIPSYLINSGISPHGYAGDIKKGPLLRAEKNLKLNSASDRVSLILCAGLTGFPVEDIDDIIIAGMGGDMIIDILSQEKRLTNKHLLILQPMTNVPKLRRYLLENSFEIIREKLAEENDKIYNIIMAEKSDKASVPGLKDMYFGVNVEENTISADYIELLKKKHRRHLCGLKAASLQNADEIRLAENIISMLEEL